MNSAMSFRVHSVSRLILQSCRRSRLAQQCAAGIITGMPRIVGGRPTVVLVLAAQLPLTLARSSL
jgi:hypothetical protein